MVNGGYHVSATSRGSAPLGPPPKAFTKGVEISGVRFRPKGKKRPVKAESQNVLADVWVVPEAIGGAEVPGVVGPGPTAADAETGIISLSGWGVRRCTVVVAHVAVPHPLLHVTVQVIKAKCNRGVPTDRLGSRFVSLAVVIKLSPITDSLTANRFSIPPSVPRHRSSPRNILRFLLTQQAVRLSRRRVGMQV